MSNNEVPLEYRFDNFNKKAVKVLNEILEETGAEIVVRCLQAEGVKHVFGYPGGAVLNIYDEIYKQDGFKHILVRHEQAAVHAAVVAEHPAEISRLTVSEAVMRMDLENQPVLMFRNSGSGLLNVVYRRAGGNIGWIDPPALDAA